MAGVRSATIIVLALALALAVVCALSTGPLGVAPTKLAAAILGGGDADARLALALRGPRVVTAVVTGGGLALAGAALQSLFRNPLVSPDLLGVSSGAGVGAAVAIVSGASPVLLQVLAFAGGLTTVAVSLSLARLAKGGDPRLSLVLCGIVTGAMASSALALIVVLADPYVQLPAVTYWLLGSFARGDWPSLGAAAVPALLGAILLGGLGFRLDVLSLGDEQARTLGLQPGRLRMVAVIAAALVTSAGVSLAGVVGWIGLIGPHIARLLVGGEARRLLPASVLTGALFALVIDRIAAMAGPGELPIGLLAAGVGAPAFLALFILNQRRRP